MSPELDKQIEDYYHRILKHLNKIANNEIVRNIPSVQEELRSVTQELIEFRRLTREAFSNGKEESK